MQRPDIGDHAVDAIKERLRREEEEGGYHLNPDSDLVKGLVRGLLVNEGRYGYRACPCRLAMGTKVDDLDIIFPCDYRDADITDYGSCYCALDVSGEIAEGKKKAGSIPERRLPAAEREKMKAKATGGKGGAGLSSLEFPIWRCTVCGYLCARDGPPEVCPICKAKKDRFQKSIG